jgi:hypothetical protein
MSFESVWSFFGVLGDLGGSLSKTFLFGRLPSGAGWSGSGRDASNFLILWALCIK